MISTCIMHLKDGMLARAISPKTMLILVLMLMPFLLSSLTFSQAALVKGINFKEQPVSSDNSVLVAGNFQYFDITLTTDEEKICVIAYHGDSIPEPEDRSVKNYYRWEYDHGVWKDTSGHASLYIKSSKCLKKNNSYSFYLGIDHEANPGHWTIKVIVDDKEVSSTPSFVMVASFNFFLSAIIGVFEPTVGDKEFLTDPDFICSDQKRILTESEKNVDSLVDEVLRRHEASAKEKKSADEILDLFLLDGKSSTKDELVKSTVSTYPRSRLKKGQTDESNSLFFNKKWGGDNVFWKNKSDGYEKLLAIILIIILSSVAFVPLLLPIIVAVILQSLL